MTDRPAITAWDNCYDDSWKGVIVDEAFAHPAKFAYGLICRIVDHGLREGYWKRGDVIGDPFGGVALGGIICGGRGLNWLGVELEERFCSLGNQNLELHGPVFMESGASMVKLVQGDSREFARIVGEVAGCVTSPPFVNPQTHNRGHIMDKGTPAMQRCKKTIAPAGYVPSVTPGQIGSLKSGSVDGAITSPPFRDARSDTTRPRPPDSMDGELADKEGRIHRLGACECGDTEGQIDKLPTGTLDAAVTSPPYESNRLDGGKTQSGSYAYRAPGIDTYGSTPGQIGNEKAKTYWQAMRQVYAQMYAALKSNAVAAIVCKDYVKAGKRVPLCDDTCRLLESIGFHVFERTRAMLVKETRHPDLFGGKDHVKRKSRKSFFRRLAESKGSPAIDWEEVIWCRRHCC